MHETITIGSMSHGPDGVGRRANGQVIFVANAAPGDVAEVEITEDRGTLSRGRLVRLLEAGEGRAATPPTECTPQADALHALAPWVHLTYEAQLASKRANVIDALRKALSLSREDAAALVAPVEPSPEPERYRNKIELEAAPDASGRLTLGVHERAGERLIPLTAYPLANAALHTMPTAIGGALRYLAKGDDLGIHRVSVRASERTRALEVALWTDRGSFPRQAAATALKSATGATSIVRVIAERGASRKVKALERLAGQGHWKERLAGCRLRVSAPAFFQVNTAVAERIVERTREWLAENPTAPVADLYAGVGTFSIPLAKAGHPVIAVEIAQAAVRNLRANAETVEDAENAPALTIIGGDAARTFDDWRCAPHVLLDPPRSGLDRKMPALLAASDAREIVYTSCDPQTWARDCARLAAVGFTLDRAQPFDMFPQTYHVETLSHFRRREI